MIPFIPFLISCGVDLDVNSYKIHLATSNKISPLDAFFAGEFKAWQEDQAHKNFERHHIVALISYARDRWLFAGVYEVEGVRAMANGRFRYGTVLAADPSGLIGRAVVFHKRTSRASYLIGRVNDDRFFLDELRQERLSIHEFPGYHNVLISFDQLKTIVRHEEAGWKGALSNMNGVYLIVDRKTGKHYIGSAYGKSGIWQRWCEYASNGHGGNKELKALLRTKGKDYRHHFQYAILEIADAFASDEYVLNREAYWKAVLMSREFGYNSN